MKTEDFDKKIEKFKKGEIDLDTFKLEQTNELIEMLNKLRVAYGR